VGDCGFDSRCGERKHSDNERGAEWLIPRHAWGLNPTTTRDYQLTEYVRSDLQARFVIAYRLKSEIVRKSMIIKYYF
jgi:hypothetical protein